MFGEAGDDVIGGDESRTRSGEPRGAAVQRRVGVGRPIDEVIDVVRHRKFEIEDQPQGDVREHGRLMRHGAP